MVMPKDGPPKDCKTLSVTCGDSSPKGRAKGWRASSHPFPMGEPRAGVVASAPKGRAVSAGGLFLSR